MSDYREAILTYLKKEIEVLQNLNVDAINEVISLAMAVVRLLRRTIRMILTRVYRSIRKRNFVFSV